MADNWRELALCRGTDPELWFSEKGSADLKLAQAVCAECPVREPCLEAGLDEKFGTWGGTSERQRRIMRSQRAARRVCRICGSSALMTPRVRTCDGCATDDAKRVRARERTRQWRERQKEAG